MTRGEMAASLTRASMRPNSLATAATIEATLSRLATSVLKKTARRPVSSRIELADSLPQSSRMSATAMSRPFLARPDAICQPMPQRRPAPVTIATLFSPLIVTFSSGEARQHRNATQGLGKVSSAPSAAASSGVLWRRLLIARARPSRDDESDRSDPRRQPLSLVLQAQPPAAHMKREPSSGLSAYSRQDMPELWLRCRHARLYHRSYRTGRTCPDLEIAGWRPPGDSLDAF